MSSTTKLTPSTPQSLEHEHEHDTYLSQLSTTTPFTALQLFLIKNHHIWEKYQASFELWLSNQSTGHQSLSQFRFQFHNWITTDPNVEMAEDIYEVIMSILNSPTTFITWTRMLSHYSSRWVVLQQTADIQQWDLIIFPSSQPSQPSPVLLATQTLQTPPATTYGYNIIKKSFPHLSALTPELIDSFKANLIYAPSATSEQSSFTKFNTLSLPQLSEALPAGIIPDLESRISLFKPISKLLPQNQEAKSCQLAQIDIPIPIHDNNPYNQVENLIAGAMQHCQEHFLQSLFNSQMFHHAYECTINLFINVYNSLYIPQNTHSPLKSQSTQTTQKLLQHYTNLPQIFSQTPITSSNIPCTPLSFLNHEQIDTIFTTLAYPEDYSIDHAESYLQTTLLWTIDLVCLWIQQGRLISLLFTNTSSNPKLDESMKTLNNIVSVCTSQVISLTNQHQSITPPDPIKNELLGALVAFFVYTMKLLNLSPVQITQTLHKSAQAIPKLQAKGSNRPLQVPPIQLQLQHLRPLSALLAYLHLNLNRSISTLFKAASTPSPSIIPDEITGIKKQSTFQTINSILQSSVYLALFNPHPIIRYAFSLCNTISLHIQSAKPLRFPSFSSSTSYTIFSPQANPLLQFNHTTLEMQLVQYFGFESQKLPAIGSTPKQLGEVKIILGALSQFHAHVHDIFHILQLHQLLPPPFKLLPYQQPPLAPQNQKQSQQSQRQLPQKEQTQTSASLHSQALASSRSHLSSVPSRVDVSNINSTTISDPTDITSDQSPDMPSKSSQDDQPALPMTVHFPKRVVPPPRDDFFTASRPRD